ncbi:glycosyltransferase [Cerasicoccus arenae]|nr:glycosyltransferase [Cerasicoccus arenae]MBK1857858.1 glycosyltransferase [Cerasicoccus arenae]
MKAAAYGAETMEQMRSVGWKIGQLFTPTPPGQYLAFVPIKSGLAYLHWALEKGSIDALQKEEGKAFDGARQTLRLYDVSWIQFNGTNAHSFFDIDVNGLWGRYYWKTDRIERYFLAETGFRLRDGRYRALARSETVFMDRAHRSGQTSMRGMYVGGRFERIIPVENIFDAPIYERVHTSWSGSLAEDLTISYFADEPKPDAAARLQEYLKNLHAAAEPLGLHFQQGSEKSAAKPNLVHAHDIGSAPAAAKLAKKSKAPLVLTLHASERERAALRGRELDPAAVKQEAEALALADWVITAHSDTRNQILADGLVPEDRVVILPDLFQGVLPKAFDPGDVKKRYHLNPARPMALFSGEISHAAGADLLMTAMEHVCGVHPEAQLVFAGNGPLRSELESRAHRSAFGERIRFVGHVARDEFMDLLAACDFVIIPARTWQDEGLAHLALENGKSVLTTHQARISCVNHGQNGLVVYDNPGSVIWGLQEMFHNPMGNGHSFARHNSNMPQSLDNLAIELCVLYNNILKTANGGAQ